MLRSSEQNPIAAAGTITLGELTVHRLGFGAMRITGDGVWGEPRDRESAKALLRHVVASGVNFIDTADSYGPHVSEELIAEALYPYPSGLVIATKGGLTRSGPNRWDADCRPAHLRAACEGSLKRLRVETIDLYQLHTVDPRVPLEESLGELIALQREGKIRSIGLSNVTVAQLQQARRLLEIVSVQNRYNLADRHSDDVLAVCDEENIAFIPWFPLATGHLAGPHGELATIARLYDAKPSQIALAWLLARSRCVLPIPGTSSREHFDENLGGASIILRDEDIHSIDMLG